MSLTATSSRLLRLIGGGVPLDSVYHDAAGQPHNLLPHGGDLVRELVG